MGASDSNIINIGSLKDNLKYLNITHDKVKQQEPISLSLNINLNLNFTNEELNDYKSAE